MVKILWGLKMDIENLKQNIRRFELMINTADEKLADELIDSKAQFSSPASSKPLIGGRGYLSIVYFMRSGFPDVQWHIEDMVVEGNKVAVNWLCEGTHTIEFMGVKPTGNRLRARFMNFYYFNGEGKIVNDVASEGMIAILRTLGVLE